VRGVMGFLGKIFGTPEERKINEIVREVERNEKPFSDLSQSILTSSVMAAEKLKAEMNFGAAKENQNQWVYVLFEFLYFSLHLTNRYAFGNLTEPQIEILHKKLGEPRARRILM